MKLVVGLGNPGGRYEETRHNVGFRIIDRLATRLQTQVAKTECHSLTGRAVWGNDTIMLAKPQTFMNNSGEAVRGLIDYYRIALPDLLVVYDDLDLPPGRVRMRAKGSAGGHNGMRSIINYLGSDMFARLRIGIGAVPEGMEGAQYVLSRFQPDELPLIEAACTAAVDATFTWAEAGIDKAMSCINSHLVEVPKG